MSLDMMMAAVDTGQSRAVLSLFLVLCSSGIVVNCYSKSVTGIVVVVSWSWEESSEHLLFSIRSRSIYIIISGNNHLSMRLICVTARELDR
jgi:hypothetical protein